MESHPLILIRAEGNAQIATGHLMRTLSIARALRQLCCEICFLIADKESVGLLRSFFTIEAEFEILFLPDYREKWMLEEASSSYPIPDYQNPSTELPLLLKLLSQRQVKCMLIDSYYVDAVYMKTLRSSVKTAYIDDLLLLSDPADIVINYDISTATAYQDTAYAKHLTGLSFCPLREQFQSPAYPLRKEASHLLITLGGTDHMNLAEAICTKVSDAYPEITCHVLTGSLNEHRSRLAALAAVNNRLILHENVRDMAGLMCSCDLAVSAAGTTLYELCAAGVPSLSFSIADNQIPGAKAFDDAGLIPYIGDARKEDILPSLLAQVSLYISDEKLRRATSEAMRAQVDGKGAHRIALALLAL